MAVLGQYYNPTNTNGQQNINSTASKNASANPPSDPTGQLSIPVTFSILISESLFLTRYSPASTLILPFYRPKIPYGYAYIIALNFITIFLVQCSAVPANGAGLLRGNVNQGIPDMNSLKKIYSYPPAQGSLRSNVPPGKISTFSAGQPSANQERNDTPLFPKGLTVNLSVSAPFSDPNSKTSTLFTLELLEIRNVPGYVVAVLTLLIYFFLYPSQQAKEENNNTKSNKNNNQ